MKIVDLQLRQLIVQIVDDVAQVEDRVDASFVQGTIEQSVEKTIGRLPRMHDGLVLLVD